MKESLSEVVEYQARVFLTGGHSEGLSYPKGLLHPLSI